MSPKKTTTEPATSEAFERVREAAQKLEVQRRLVAELGSLNSQGLSLDNTIKRLANLRINQDICRLLEQQYQEAFNEYAKELK